MGDCYFNGEGTQPDYAQAFKLYESQAKKNNPHALYSLGFCYESGKGARMNIIRANAMYQLAAHYCTSGNKSTFESYAQKTSARLSKVDQEKADKIRDEWLNKQ